MNLLKLVFLLALIPTLLHSSEDTRGKELYGLWYDNYSNTKLEINYTRRGIKVKQHGRLFGRWRTYSYVGRGLYDDYDGRVIVSRGYNQIEWRTGRNRRLVLSRYNSYDRYDNYDRGYTTSRSRSYNPSYNSLYSRDQYCGTWYNNDRGYNLRVEAYGGRGFRVRFDNQWSYYEPYKDHYRDRRGNRYYLKDKYLTWRSNDGKRSLRFRRR